ncbi:MAG: hypothetical protein RSF40_04880 [Oscillospiraceae bacterium]
MITPVGWMRNLQNFGGAIASVGRLAGGAIPALGALGGVLGSIAKLAVGGKLISMATTAIPLFVGSKILQSQRMGEAGANLMRFGMAEKGLGGDYRGAFNSATQLAGEYGYSRTGMLDAINMFTGLNVGGKGTLNRGQATDISRIIGKISALGNLPFEKVSTNVQQLLGQPKTQIRDVRELIGQAPFINKLAQQRMARTNTTGDVREFLKDKANLLAVLSDFDKMVESNPLMKARGKIALVKENFYLKLAEVLDPYWDSIVSGVGQIYDNLGSLISEKLKNFSPESFLKDVKQLATDIDNILRGIMWFMGKVSSIFSWFAKAWGGLPDVIKNLADPSRVGLPRSGDYVTKYKQGANGSITPVSVFTSTQTYRDEIAAYNNNVLNNSRATIFKNGITDPSNVNVVAAILAGKQQTAGNTIFASAGFKPSSSQLIEARNVISKKANSISNYEPFIKDYAGLPNQFDSSKFINMIQADRNKFGLSGLGDGNSLNTDAGTSISDVTKGSRSVIINFNKEIVSMPISIAQVGDMAQAWETYIRARVEDTITRGLNIALNNATGAL